MVTEDVDAPEWMLTTRGIASDVLVDPSATHHGHALLMDYDDMGYSQVLDRVCNLPGMVVILESSPGSYHVYNSTIRPIDGTALKMLELKCDPMHASVGYRRGRWTLRIGTKDRVNSSAGNHEYKAPPEYRDHIINPNKWGLQHSRTHMEVLYDRYDEVPHPDECGEELPWVKGKWRTEQYLTMTDEKKEMDQ